MRSTISCVLLFAACGAPSGAAQDGAPIANDSALPSDSPRDASPVSDAPRTSDSGPLPPDATVCAAGDQDGDGVCDDVDDCPTVFDPGQVDLDHDHLGFACDPTESVSFDDPGSGLVISAFATDDAFAVTLGGTTVAYVAAEPRGSIVTTADNPATPWAATVPFTFETAASHLVVAPDVFTDDAAGELDITSGALVSPVAGHFPLGQGPFQGTVEPDRIPAAIPLQDAAGGDLYVPVAGAAMTPVSHVVGGYATFFIAPQSVPASHTLLLPSNTKAPFRLQSFAAGDAAPTDIVTGADDLKFMGTGAGTVLYCARTGADVSVVMASASSISTATLPFTSCPFEGFPTVAGTDLILTTSEAGVLLRDGAAITLFTGLGGVGIRDVQHTPTELAITLTSNQVFVVDPDASVHAVGNGLTSVTTSANGSTVHVLGTDAASQVHLIRHRPNVADQEVVFPKFVNITDLVTTPEGAALAFEGSLIAVPSGSMTVVSPTTRSGRNTGTTRDHAFVTLGQSGQDALFQYDEVAGVPRLTQVTPATFPFDVLPRGTTYFTLDRNDFELARVDVVGGLPTVVSIVTDQPAGFIGRDRSGAELWLDPQVHRLYRGTPTELVEVARGTSLTAIVDSEGPEPAIVGWRGEDALGGFVCMADAPDRCWTIPAGFFPRSTSTVRGATVDDDRIRMIDISTIDTHVTVTVFHNVGAPDRPQPLL